VCREFTVVRRGSASPVQQAPVSDPGHAGPEAFAERPQPRRPNTSRPPQSVKIQAPVRVEACTPTRIIWSPPPMSITVSEPTWLTV